MIQEHKFSTVISKRLLSIILIFPDWSKCNKMNRRKKMKALKFNEGVGYKLLYLDGDIKIDGFSFPK